MPGSTISTLAVFIAQVRRVRCEQSGVLVPKDKAIKRFIVRNIVDASAIRDIQEACVYDGGFQKSIPEPLEMNLKRKRFNVDRPS